MAEQKKKNSKKDKKTYRNNNFINIFILAIVFLVVAYVAFKIVKLAIKPTNTLIVEPGTVSSEEETVGYIIREETVIKGNGNKNYIIPIKAEGEKVAKNDKVYRYSGDNEEELLKKTEDLNEKIQEALKGKPRSPNSDIRALDRQIETKIDNIRLKNNMQDILEYKKDINKYVEKKAKITGELSTAGSYIKELMKEKEKVEKQISSNSEYMVTKKSGVVSYRVDNLEEVLTTDSINDLNKKKLEELDIKAGEMVASSNNMGKVINNFYCYIITNLKSEESKKAEVGDRIKLRLSTGDEIYGTIKIINSEKDGSKNIAIRITDCVQKLIDYRKISLDIVWWEKEGLKVPLSSIIYDNGLSYIVRNRAGYLDKILVNKLKENNKYCIIDNYTTEELEKLGYKMAEINNMKRLSIYDEIVIAPDLSKLQ